MRRVSTGLQALMLIAVIAMQSVGAWCCLAEAAACCAPSVETSGGVQRDCCGGDSEPTETPACCVDASAQPHMLSIAEKFQHLEPSEVDLPNWGAPEDARGLHAQDLIRRFFVGVDPPPDYAVLTARRCVRQI